MSNRRTLLTAALGVIAATTLSTEALAQARSDRTIPLRKGETAAPARTDTVVVRDTVRMSSVDTVTVIRRDTVVQRVEVAPAPTPFGRFYAGLLGGAALPIQALGIPQSTGWTVGGLVGWDSYRAPLGLRLDGGYSSFGEDDEFIGDDVDLGDPELWHANIDAKLRLPFLSTSPVSLYAVGGATYNRFRGFTFIDDDNANAIVLADDNWHDKWGGNIGAGIGFNFGRANMFIESRFQTMNIGNTSQNHVPVVLGITF